MLLIQPAENVPLSIDLADTREENRTRCCIWDFPQRRRKQELILCLENRRVSPTVFEIGFRKNKLRILLLQQC